VANFQYKFTLGSWTSGEETSSCGYVNNRTFGFDTAMAAIRRPATPWPPGRASALADPVFRGLAYSGRPRPDRINGRRDHRAALRAP